MTSKASVEQMARQLLDVFAEFKLRAGQCLSIANIKMVLHERAERSMDFQRASEYAVAQGWIELQKHTWVYRLTPKGHAALADQHAAATELAAA
ncbi:MAG: hypothetical protein M0Q15_15480 [Nevskia sp.]|jgi:hypothetical protein|nr:hypothetical protein [Nevskia sp.]